MYVLKELHNVDTEQANDKSEQYTRKIKPQDLMARFNLTDSSPLYFTVSYRYIKVEIGIIPQISQKIYFKIADV